jgi:uncharacterized membrane protein YbaN (DUF454 family)
LLFCLILVLCFSKHSKSIYRAVYYISRYENITYEHKASSFRILLILLTCLLCHIYIQLRFIKMNSQTCLCYNTKRKIEIVYSEIILT